MIPTEPDPATYRDPCDLLRAHAEATPDKAFLVSVDDGRSMTFGELWRLSNRLANFLADRGIGPGGRVAVLSQNSLEKFALYFAVLRTGATFCTIDVEVNAAHLREMLNRIEPELVLTSGDFAIEWVGDRLSIGTVGADDGLFGELARASETPVRPFEAAPDDFAVISFTSGTSAAPKGVLHTFGNYFRIAEQSIAMWGLMPDDRILEYRSISWASAHMLSLHPCLVVGATILLAGRFSASRFFDWVRAYEPTISIGIPAVVNMLLERAGEATGDELRSLRFMTCSTAPLMVESHRRFEETYGVKLVQIYGMSEGGVLAGNHHDDRRIGTVGRPGLYQNLLIVGPDGREVAQGEIGEVEIGGAQTAYGYLHPDRSIEKIRNTRLTTGDLGYLDDDGFLHLTGRAKDIINRGGVNISPLEIDDVLARHAAVAEAATIGVPDAILGEAIVSYVVVADGGELLEDTLHAHCAASLPAFKRPRQFVTIDALPRNDRGKTDRAALLALWRG